MLCWLIFFRGCECICDCWGCSIPRFMWQRDCERARKRSYWCGHTISHCKGWYLNKRWQRNHVCTVFNRKEKLTEVIIFFPLRLRELRWWRTTTGCSVQKVSMDGWMDPLCDTGLISSLTCFSILTEVLIKSLEFYLSFHSILCLFSFSAHRWDFDRRNRHRTPWEHDWWIWPSYTISPG